MAVKTNAQLAAFFETGDQPSETEFGHLIDTIAPTPVLLTDADTTLTEAANAMRINILPDLSANRTFSIPTPSAAGIMYRFIYGGAAEDTDNHIIDTVTTDNSVYFKGCITLVDTDGNSSVDYSNGSSNSKVTLTDTGDIDITFISFSTTIWYVSGFSTSADTAAFADQ
tara:strand:+ start:904 stop:1410 length:507 start_codon:yes stop_codon:yes gene_type:complete